ncbi:hypothetical protein B0T16DRAFT_353944 [Cercophora newfieldiana]|uniref:Uncharacterized protein n=1 Tax=Cercophora newfieldiana TaxID=92897 RepID=A0AA40CQM2_9PEZI|nr:hypothetical protein B0T16DRAFT_353944 [Cercophora newfieldiana]
MQHKAAQRTTHWCGVRPLQIFSSLLHTNLQPQTAQIRMDDSDDSLNLSSHFSGGLVEIAALTTLIGSAAAEALVLGDRGGAGLAWAGMSAFGILSLAKGCLAGSAPDWLRSTLGVRDSIVDAALGMRLDIRSKYKSSQDLARRDLGPAKAVAVIIPPTAQQSSSAWIETGPLHLTDIYALDRFATGPLNSVLNSPEGDLPVVYTFIRDPSYRPVTRADWIALSLSSLKLVEMYALFRLGRTHLYWVTALPGFFFLSAALLLQSKQATRGYARHEQTELDVLLGELPSAKVPGGVTRKILLRMPENFRRSKLWRAVWSLGALVCVASLLATYILLSKEDSNTFLTWLSFQLLWLGARLVVYPVMEGTDLMQFPALVGQDWQDLSPVLKTRALRLLWALAGYQMHVHPRGSYCYLEDQESIGRADSLLMTFKGRYRTAVPSLPRRCEAITVAMLGIWGDTVLASAAWLGGSTLAGMDVYDSVIVFLEVSGEVVAVPAVRVLSGTSLKAEIARAMGDPENSRPRFRMSKGLPNAGTGTYWIYWIPCEDGRWLQLETEEMKILGRRQAAVMTDAQVSGRLDEPSINVSMSSAEDVKEALSNTEKAVAVLEKLL